MPEARGAGEQDAGWGGDPSRPARTVTPSCSPSGGSVSPAFSHTALSWELAGVTMGRLACKQENEEITIHCYQQSPSDKGFNQRWNEMKSCAPTGSEARTPGKGQSEGSFEASRLLSVSRKCRS